MTTRSVEKIVAPPAETSPRILYLFLIIDCSASMSGRKMEILNQAMREAMNALKNEAEERSDTEFRILCIVFSSGASWHPNSDAINIENYSWQDVSVGDGSLKTVLGNSISWQKFPNGGTATGSAVQLLTSAIKAEKMPRRGCPPVMVLISDGDNTDGSAYSNAIDALDREPWGTKAVRLAIGVGDHFNTDQLGLFNNQPKVGVLEARNAVDLANYIKYATVTATMDASQASTKSGSLNNNVNISPAPAPAVESDDIKLEVF